MTTIAWDGASLAADTLITTGGHRDGYAPKIARIGDILVAAAGGTVHCQAFRRWIDTREGPCPLIGLSEDERANGLIIPPTGPLTMWCSHGEWTFDPPGGIYALGSGSEYALGAMSMGADARTAVEIAMRHDTTSGGEITVLRR